MERRSRRLTWVCGGCLLFPVLALLGFQSPTDVLRAKRIEIVNDANVPLVTLEASRTGQGGSLVIRDSKGEKRSWWEVDPSSSTLTLTSATPDGTVDTTLGLQTGPKNGRLAIISQDGSMTSTSIEGSEPKLQLVGPKGRLLFAAPWKPIGF